MTDKHTPLPWRTTVNAPRKIISDKKGKKICMAVLMNRKSNHPYKTECEAIANAELIVKAVNNYHRLVEENKRLREALADMIDLGQDENSEIENGKN